MGAVQNGTFDRNPMYSSLDDCVLLGVDGSAKFVTLAGRYAELIAQAADVKTVGGASRSAVVAGGEQTFVVYQDSADLAAQTGRARCRLLGKLQKVVVPARPLTAR